MKAYSCLSLLESILLDSGCRTLGELSAITKERRQSIAAHMVSDIPPDVPTLQDYNEALHYLLCVGPEDTKEKARARLLEGLLS